MPRAYAGRVYLKPVGNAALLHYAVHDAVGGRRAAYIAKAHKKYSYFLFVFQRVNKFYCFMVYVVVYHFIFLLDEVGHLNYKCKVNEFNPKMNYSGLANIKVPKIICIFATK